MKSPQSAGGIARGAQRRHEALTKYYLKPNICKQCKEVIKVGSRRVSDTRKKIFCNQSCACTHGNLTSPRKRIAAKKYCADCGKQLENRSRRKFCDKCHHSYFDRLTCRPIGKCTHPQIRGHARIVLESSKKKPICQSCSYSKHVNACHKKPVSAFPKTTLIGVVNHLSNLLYLCPNCHWEFDHRLLSI